MKDSNGYTKNIVPQRKHRHRATVAGLVGGCWGAILIQRVGIAALAQSPSSSSTTGWKKVLEYPSNYDPLVLFSTTDTIRDKLTIYLLPVHNLSYNATANHTERKR